MEDKDPTPPVQVPSEANDYRHIDSAGTSDDNTGSTDKGRGDSPLKNEAGGLRNEFSFTILQTEYDIDPGNEHHHQVENDANKDDTSSDKDSLHATDAEGDGLGTTGY